MTRACRRGLLLLLVTAGCSPARAPKRAAPGPHFDVVERGVAPRRRLRHAFHPGALVPLEVSSVTRVLRDDRELARAFTQAPLDSRIASLDRTGGARFEFTLGPIELGASGDRRALRLLVPRTPERSALDVRLTGSASIDARGVVSALAIDQKPTPERRLAFALAASALASIAPFPRDAVGIGARWLRVTRARFGARALELRARYRLIAGPHGAARLLVQHDEPLTLGTAHPKLVVRSSAGEWTFYLDQVFPRGFERLTHALAPALPKAAGLAVTGEVHIGAR